MKSFKILITVLTLGAVAFVSTASAQDKGKGKGQMGPAAQAVYNGLMLDMSFYSRLRQINAESSFSVNG